MLTTRLETHLQTFSLQLQFTAETGRTTVLLGESGAGKSTVLRLLAGLLHPDRGLIELDGVVYFDSERRIASTPQERPFGYVFQDYTLFPHLTVFENVAFGLRAQGLPDKQVRQRTGEALEMMHLVGYDRQRPSQLSGGQQQRVALARTLVLQPELLLLDEPLSALDVQTRREVRQELRRILRQTEITTVLVTHQYIEALLLGQQILVLDGGRVVQRGGQQDLLQRPRSPYVAELVGMNFFQGKVSQCEGSTVCTIRLESDDGPGMELQAMVAEDGKLNGAMPAMNQEAYVVVDPRSITLSTEAPTGSARNVFRGEVTQIVSTGINGGESSQYTGRVRVNLLVASSPVPMIAELTAASAEHMGLSEGQSVYASFKAMEARVYT